MTLFSPSKIGAVVLTGALAVSLSALAAGDAAVERQALMKNVGGATKILGGMAKGEQPFDLASAQQAMKVLNSAALGFGYMFPDGSQEGAKTEASPAIWSDREGFNKAVAKFIADTSVPLTDEAGFKAVFGGAASNCGSCHKAYRVKN